MQAPAVVAHEKDENYVVATESFPDLLFEAAGLGPSVVDEYDVAFEAEVDPAEAASAIAEAAAEMPVAGVSKIGTVSCSDKAELELVLVDVGVEQQL